MYSISRSTLTEEQVFLSIIDGQSSTEVSEAILKADEMAARGGEVFLLLV